MGNWWDPFEIERPGVNFIAFFLYHFAFISICWSTFLIATGAVDMPDALQQLLQKVQAAKA